MEQFLRVTAIVLMSIIVVLMLKGRDQVFAQLLSILVCTIVCVFAVQGIHPVFEFVHNLRGIIDFDSNLMNILLKSVGISVTAEIAELICQDSGNSAMGKAIQLLATAIISCLCIPMLSELLELIQEVLSRI